MTITNLRKNVVIHYYKLKQVDFDGNYEYSDVISISNNQKSEIKYYDFLGKQVKELIPYNFYIKEINGIGHKILFTN